MMDIIINILIIVFYLIAITFLITMFISTIKTDRRFRKRLEKESEAFIKMLEKNIKEEEEK